MWVDNNLNSRSNPITNFVGIKVTAAQKRTDKKGGLSAVIDLSERKRFLNSAHKLLVIAVSTAFTTGGGFLVNSHCCAVDWSSC